MVFSRRRVAKPPQAISPRPFIGMCGMAAVFFLYAASGVVAPWWGVVLLLLVWLAFFIVALAWWTPFPDRLPWLPVIATVVWFLALVGGGVFLGWGD